MWLCCDAFECAYTLTHACPLNGKINTHLSIPSQCDCNKCFIYFMLTASGHITNEEIIPRFRSYLRVKTSRLSLLRCLPDASLWRYSEQVQLGGDPQGRPRAHQRDFMSHWAWKCLKKCPKRKLEDVVEEIDVCLWKLLCFVC